MLLWVQIHGQLRLDCLNTRQAGGETGGEGAGEFVVGYADGLVDVFERVFGEDAVFGLAEDQADGGGIAGMAELGVHCRAVEIHFAGILGFEVAFF